MKPVLWINAAKNDLMDMPENVITDFGYALYQAQLGEHPAIAKPLKGFGSASVLELVANNDNDTYRVVYTVRFTDALVVIHAFQKKSKQGIKTPKQEIDLIHDRLTRAEVIYKEWKAKGGQIG
ncbi:MAG: type II toxin-antitoxin system RelE/ParE family toxin [Parachlamydiaceae bacterium]|nr:type II toxin-antitoxin system RelE/ParE family toxin [Parachlamydiaceae bacterium]